MLTAKGAEGWDTLSVGWDPWHEMRPVIRARVIDPTIQSTISIRTPSPKNRHAAATTRPTVTERGCTAPLPAIAPGVVVEEEYLERETEPFFAPGRVGRAFFGHERSAGGAQ